MLNAALTILHDEHRSFSTIVHGLDYLLREIRDKGRPADFELLGAMIHYLDGFAEKMHHPKEEAYLFARLRARTDEADGILNELEKQHATRKIRDLKQALGYYEAGKQKGLERFAATVKKFGDATRQHVKVEEEVVIPLAKRYLTPADWVELAEAFGENGDPRFGVKIDDEFRYLFSRIVKLAPPPIGVGPAN